MLQKRREREHAEHHKHRPRLGKLLSIALPGWLNMSAIHLSRANTQLRHRLRKRPQRGMLNVCMPNARHRPTASQNKKHCKTIVSGISTNVPIRALRRLRACPTSTASRRPARRSPSHDRLHRESNGSKLVPPPARNRRRRCHGAPSCSVVRRAESGLEAEVVRRSCCHSLQPPGGNRYFCMCGCCRRLSLLTVPFISSKKAMITYAFLYASKQQTRA